MASFYQIQDLVITYLHMYVHTCTRLCREEGLVSPSVAPTIRPVAVNR